MTLVLQRRCWQTGGMRTALLAIVALACLPAIAASKDLVLDQRLDPAIDGVSEQKQYLSEKRLITDGPVIRTIVDAETNTVTIADKENKVYTVVPFQTLRSRLASSLSPRPDNTTLSDEMLKRLPPEARANASAQLDQFRAQQAAEGTPIALAPTGRSETIAGHQAKEFALNGGTVTGTVWTTEDITISPELMEMAQARTGGDKNVARIAQAFRALKGMPLASAITISFGENKVTRSITTTSVTEGKAPVDVAGPPTGFKKLDLDPFLAAISG